MKRTIVWFRGKDLRLRDHAPLVAAVASGEVIPLFVLDPYFFAPSRARELPHRMQFLLESLAELAAGIAARGSRLLLVEGRSTEVVPRLAATWRADRVVAHRWVEPFGRERDRRIDAALGGRLELFEGETLLPPGTLRTQAGRPYSVFGQFARAFQKHVAVDEPLPAPRSLPPLPHDVTVPTVPLPTLQALGITRNPALLSGGERAASARLRRFLRHALSHYARDRDRLDRAGTSRLSADLKFGTLSPRTVWRAIMSAMGPTEPTQNFLSELVWREFAYSTLFDDPRLLERPFRAEFVDFPWSGDPAHWEAWERGYTGYPIVDAAARQLLAEGFVHNRARMVAASFLTKHLLIDYRRGEAHYLKYLTDGDWAQNNFNWQWSAGCGCDAQPYFRVFNPVTQGTRFDPEGDYVRRWLPVLARLPARFIHRPFAAPAAVLRAAGVQLGRDYPHPVVDHQTARQRYLALVKAHLVAARRSRPSTGADQDTAPGPPSS